LLQLTLETLYGGGPVGMKLKYKEDIGFQVFNFRESVRATLENDIIRRWIPLKRKRHAICIDVPCAACLFL
jgi:hypothetical protein